MTTRHNLYGLLVLIAMTSAILMSCRGRVASRDEDSVKEVLTVQSDYTADAERWTDSLVSSMTDEEMAGQLFMPSVYARDDDASMTMLRRYVQEMQVGGVVLLKGTGSATRNICDSVSKWSDGRAFVAIDAEWGLGMRLSDSPSYPMNGRLTDVTEDDMFDYGAEIARQAHSLGINLVLGPVADVLPDDGTKGYIGDRSFGSDAERVANLSTAYARGLESGGVMSCVKHFPGHGSARGDSHKLLPRVYKNSEELRSADLLPFRRYINAGLSAVMVGHIAVPALDSTMVSSSESRRMITDILRDEMRFDGLILTDALNMGGACGGSAVSSLQAGADIILSPADTKTAINSVLAAMAGGMLNREDVKRHCRRILFYKYRFCRIR